MGLNHLRIVIPFVLLNFLLGCFPIPLPILPVPIPTPDPIPQIYVFEISYENTTLFLAKQQHGIFITNDGAVSSYDQSSLTTPFAAPASGVFHELDLQAKYSANLLPVGQVDEVDLLLAYNKIPAAQLGNLTSKSVFSLDSAIYKFVAYVHDEDTRTYTPVTLWQTGGSTTITNDAPAAREILDWLVATAEQVGYYTPIPPP